MSGQGKRLEIVKWFRRKIGASARYLLAIGPITYLLIFLAIFGYSLGGVYYAIAGGLGLYLMDKFFESLNRRDQQELARMRASQPPGEARTDDKRAGEFDPQHEAEASQGQSHGQPEDRMATTTPADKTSDHIAIIGTEGSGKTVLIAALAKHIDSCQSQGWFLDPQNVQTQQYVDRIWSALTAGKWPPLTAPNTFQQLRWKVRSPNNTTATMRILDPPGHDIRRLFSDNRSEPGAVPDDLQELADYCRNAAIVIFLVNLKDFLGQPNLEMRSATELALKFGMEYVKQAGSSTKQCCLVFTQVDQYPGLADEEGTWANVARKYLPRLFGGQLSQGDIPVLAVSAVSSTQLVVDAQGMAEKIPARGFQSEGFDELLSWIEEAEGRWIEEAEGRLDLQAVLKLAHIVAASAIGILVGAAVAIGGLIAVLFACIWIWNLLFPPPGLRPVPAVSDGIGKVFWPKEIPLLGSDFGLPDIEITGKVANTGAAGHITVIAEVTQGAKTWRRSETYFLKHGESIPCRFVIDEYDGGQWDPPRLFAKPE
jgi:hypothetical protein